MYMMSPEYPALVHVHVVLDAQQPIKHVVQEQSQRIGRKARVASAVPIQTHPVHIPQRIALHPGADERMIHPEANAVQPRLGIAVIPREEDRVVVVGDAVGGLS